jgi:hypothetical protein
VNQTPLYVLSGWDKENVTNASDWAGYLKQRTGVRGRSWLAKQGYGLTFSQALLWLMSTRELIVSGTATNIELCSQCAKNGGVFQSCVSSPEMSSVDGKRRGLFARACAICIWHSQGAQCEFYGGKSAHWDCEMNMCVHLSGLSAFFRSVLIPVGRFFSKVASGPSTMAITSKTGPLTTPLTAKIRPNSLLPRSLFLLHSQPMPLRRKRLVG